MLPNKIITLTTDFGKAGGYAGAVKGVLLEINPNLKIVDVTHEVSCFNVLEGALVLNSFYQFFPKGTIHLAVVDPGVGGKRKGILIRTDNYFFVGPDNGIFSFVYEQERVRKMVNITNSEYFLRKPSSSFHARDIFAPVSAYLSLGVKPGEFGSPAQDCYKLKLPQPLYRKDHLLGEIIYIDGFGNLITNISSSLISNKSSVRIRVRSKIINHLSQYYEEEKNGKLLALIGSGNFFEISVNQGNAQRLLKAKVGDKITIENF
ncbi:MAG TPA: SAM-dependent chlorinase/fluorinase [Terriglobales bacterium]|nr:SAM-dependent chlorinase/fluorinase [Terriglobales bacterium]